MPRRTSLNLLLALLLLLAHQLAAAHGLTHRDDGTLPDKACQLCTMSVPLGAGLPSAVPAIDAAPCVLERHSHAASCFTSPLRLAFHSRAPPAVAF
jgi:hypothetical protein